MDNLLAPDPALKLIDDLGIKAIMGATGVGYHAVRYARFTKKLPSRWYGPLSILCDQRGIPCPLDAFAWAEPAAVKSGNEGTETGHIPSHGHPPSPRKGAA